MYTHLAGTVTVLVLGALTNVFFVLVLRNTWKLLRQVKRYLAFLLIANWLEVCFAFTQRVTFAVEKFWWGSEAACKFLTMMSVLGTSMATMATAALSLHLLMTAITGSQGSKLRHFLVIGLFVLLGLVWPIVTLGVAQRQMLNPDLMVCRVSASYPGILFLAVGSTTTLFFFPLLVLIVCWAVAAILSYCARSYGVKADEDRSDFLITGLLGLTILLCCVPNGVVRLLDITYGSGSAMMKVNYGLWFWSTVRNALSAIVSVVFAWVYAYQHRNDVYNALGNLQAEKPANDAERQKLVG